MKPFEVLNRAIRKIWTLSLRRVFYYGGYGVHSPFAFDFITKVIEDKTDYPCYQSFISSREKMLDESINENKIFSKTIISNKEGRLLFRLVNYFTPDKIWKYGLDCDIASLYLTAFPNKTRCIMLSDFSFDNKEELGFVYFDAEVNESEFFSLFEKCLKSIGNDTVFIVKGIHSTQNMKQFWSDSVRRNKKVILSFDLYSIGIIIFNARFFKQNYKVSY